MLILVSEWNVWVHSYKNVLQVWSDGLFTDAEVGEDVIENLGGGDDATSDVGKGIETLTEVFAQKVVGDVHLKTIKNPGDALLGLKEGGIVTGWGDDGIVLANLWDAWLGIDGIGKFVDACTIQCTDGEGGEGDG